MIRLWLHSSMSSIYNRRPRRSQTFCNDDCRASDLPAPRCDTLPMTPPHSAPLSVSGWGALRPPTRHMLMHTVLPEPGSGGA